MARIRTIKPEFCQAEKVGRLSRDARLLFIQLWTFVDDLGRCRGSSRLLAASLYPYDDDAAALIDGWIAELEAENCVRRYFVDGATYLDIPKWSKHQRIDNAGKSRLPEFRASSRRVAANLCDPPLYLGPRTIGPSTEDLGPSRSLRSLVRADDDWPEDFRERFWQQYPRKVGRKSAFTKLDAIKRRGDVTFVKLMAGVAKIPSSEPRFIPHPTTWLNRGGWDDEVLPLNGASNAASTSSDCAYELAGQIREHEIAAGLGRPPDVVGSDDLGGRPIAAVPER